MKKFMMVFFVVAIGIFSQFCHKDHNNIMKVTFGPVSGGRLEVLLNGLSSVDYNKPVYITERDFLAIKILPDLGNSVELVVVDANPLTIEGTNLGNSFGCLDCVCHTIYIRIITGKPSKGGEIKTFTFLKK